MRKHSRRSTFTRLRPTGLGTWLPAFATTLLAFSLGACTNGDGLDGSDGGGGTSGVVTGTLTIAPPIAPLTEAEPNDSVDEPQPVGELAPGRAITIRGSIGAGEGFDGFAFVAPSRVQVGARLHFTADAARRVELVAYDPLAMGVVARADADGSLSFTAGGAFDLVVRGAQGAGDYELVVRAGAAAGEFAQDGWLGAISTGDELRVGSAAGGRYELTAAEALDLRVTVQGPAGAVVQVLSTTRDGDGAPTSIAAGSSLALPRDPLERTVILTPAGVTATIEALARAATQPLRPVPQRLLATERERAAFGLATGDVLYSRAASNVKLGELLVKARGASNLAEDLTRRGLARIDQVGEDVLQVAADLGAIADESSRARTTVALGRSLAASPRVEYAELNRLRRAYGGTTPFTPDDTFYASQWHYPLIRLPEAWGEVQNFITQPNLTGDVVVAVIDTGRRPHPDLDANTRTDIEYDFITDPAVAADGNGPDADATDPGDGSGVVPSSYHGTHVAGTIAAVSDNGSGVAGVGSLPVFAMPAPVSRVKVVHLRVLGVGGGTDADIARAVRYAAGLTNPGLPTLVERVEVINMSLGGPNSNTTLQNAVTAARNAGATVFAAAGNENTSTPSYPAAYANVVSVAAVDQNLQRAPYSNFNASVDLCAPGGDAAVDVDGDGYIDGVLSTLVDSTLSPNYVFYQGTSMACPHAAGLAALMLVVAPQMLPGEIENRLATTATDLGATGRDNLYGNGLINALAAVQSAGTGAPTGAQLVVSPAFLNFSPDTSQLVLTLRNAGIDPIDVVSYTDNVPWMTLGNGGPATGIDIGSITVTIDRSDPALDLDGTYADTISITTGDGTVLVPVTVIVSRPFLPDVELFVLAIDSSVDPPVTVAQAVVNPASDGLDYVLDELSTADGELLPPGEYLVVCGSDEDDDGFICGDGDVYCGLYPTLNDPALIRVNGPVAGVDFLVAPLDSDEALTGLPGFPRRAGPSPARSQP